MSISYAFLSYYTAYLKANYPIEFYCSCISCETDPEAQSIYINDAKSKNIEIIPPDINNSNLDFSVYNGKILYGLKGLKGIGEKAIQQILEHKPYTSGVNFLTKIVDNKLKIPKQVIEALIKIGAFDSLGINRRLFLDSYDSILNKYKSEIKKGTVNTFSYADDFFNLSKKDVELSVFDVLTYERQYMGIYISGNPFDYAKPFLGSVSSYSEALNNETSTVFCEVLSKKETKTKSKGEKMGIIKAIDNKNIIFEFPIFPELYKKYSEIISEGSFLIVNFKNSSRGIICLSIKNVNSLLEEYTKTQKSEHKINSISIKIYNIKDLKKILLRQSKDTNEDESLLRPCSIYYYFNNYIFKIGIIKISSSNSSIRLLNEIEGIEVSYNR